MEFTMKIGIMGGTFDPIHIGHLLLGEFAYENFSLDEIWFLPNGNPPHKSTDESGVSLADRIEMVRLATEDIPYFRVNLYEASAQKHSYTFSTMKALRGMHDPCGHARRQGCQKHERTDPLSKREIRFRHPAPSGPAR